MQLPWAQINPFAKADRNTVSPEPQVRPQQQQSNPNGDTNRTSDMNPNDPNNKNNKTKVTGDDPMADFDSLWEPNKNEKGEVIVKDNTPKSYLPAVDQKKLQEMVDKMDFTKGLTSEEIEAVKAGGEGALGAFANMINRAGRQAFTTSFQAATRLSEQGVAKAHDRFMEGIPAHVREMMVDEGINSDIGITQNPAFAPLVRQVKAQFLEKFPKATPNQVRKGVKQYFDHLENTFAEGRKKNVKTDDAATKLRTGADDADFLTWLGDEATAGNGGMFGDSNEEEPIQT